MKESLKKSFEKSIRPKRLIEAIYENKFPVFNVDLEVSFQSLPGTVAQALYFKSLVTNIGGAAAFNFQLYWKGEKNDTIEAAIMSPNQNELMSFFYTLGGDNNVTKRMIIEYQSPIGISVIDEFEVSAKIVPLKKDIVYSSKLIERKFHESNDILLDVSNI